MNTPAQRRLVLGPRASVEMFTTGPAPEIAVYLNPGTVVFSAPDDPALLGAYAEFLGQLERMAGDIRTRVREHLARQAEFRAHMERPTD